MTPELIEKFYIEREVAEIMAEIYNAYIASGHATLEDCQQSLIISMGMLDLNLGLDDTINNDANNEAYYLARGLVRLPFDSQYMGYAGNSLPEDVKNKLATAEFVR